jgi:UDP-glucuronate 4-epimerase
MNILITGVAGFIGFHCSQRLLAQGHHIFGIDNLNGYYDVQLKQARLQLLKEKKQFIFAKIDLSDREGMSRLFHQQQFDMVLHLGAQAGVRHSIDDPFAYIDSNITGMLTVLEGCRNHGVKHLIYASSSSVYGANTKLPFSVEDRVDTPVSLYAATKKADEMMSFSYASLYGIPITGLRFFTVYGPWGRPDMAYFKFADAIMSRRAIDIYNHGDMKRDFTYIDDIVDGIEAIISQPFPIKDGCTPHRLYNLGNSTPEKLMDMIAILETELGRVAEKRFLPMQLGDVPSTFADIEMSKADLQYLPKTTLAVGLSLFAKWYKAYYYKV